ncbi:MAG: hypothetical protein JXR68_07860 [Bacteroidales bacterium]|nr:hypothetical protein [Bacteroidales bacterium]
MESKLKKNEFLFKSNVKISLYFLLLVLFFMIIILTTSLGSFLTIKAWVLVFIYLAIVIFVLTTLKTIRVFVNGIEVKYILNQKTKFYKYEQIKDYDFGEIKENFIKMKNLKLIFDGKTITISSLIYTKLDLIYEQIKINASKLPKNE